MTFVETPSPRRATRCASGSAMPAARWTTCGVDRTDLDRTRTHSVALAACLVAALWCSAADAVTDVGCGAAYARPDTIDALQDQSIPLLRSGLTTRGFIVFAVPPSNNAGVVATALDLNGDGSIDNQLGQVLAVLASNGIDFSAPVRIGEVVSLMRVTSIDPTFIGDPAARAEWIVGRPTTPLSPDFSGAGRFALDGQFEPTPFVAPLAGAQFQSADPVTTTTPVTANLQFGLGGRVVLPLNGARIRFTVGANGLVSGQLNGSIRDDDIDAFLIPGFAAEFNEVVATGGPTAQSILGLFDDGCNGVGALDGFITPCEVEDSLLGALLEPDVDIFDAQGQYAPNPLNVDLESISFGTSFTAANAVVPSETVFASGFE
jgi:hypothetical protein